MHIQNTLRATQRESYKERRILLDVSQFGAFFSCSSDIMEAHKYLGNCSMYIQNMAGAALFYHIGA